MKRNILHTLWAAALLLTGCTQEELPLPGADNAAPLAITITDGGYALTTSADGSQKAATRATEDGYRTEFTASDACGLYLVRNGAIVYDNVKLTATAGTNGSLTWQPEAGVTLAGGMAGEKYFLYYPYQETAKMAGKVNATDTTSDGEFFKPLIDGWQPGDDQSTHAAYTASDLMTAGGSTTGTGSTIHLSFAMKHRMALAVIEMPKTVYKFIDANVPDYTVGAEATFTGTAKPLRMADGTYRYLVHSSMPTIEGCYDGGNREFTITTSASHPVVGEYKRYKVDGAQAMEKNYNLQMGDYLCKNSDGNWYIIPGEEMPNEECIAIVFHAGHHENDASDYSATGIGQQKCHGYAIALQDATNGYCQWGVYGTELGCCPTDGSGNKQNNYSTPDIDWSGYAWTQKIIAAAGGTGNLNAAEDSGYPATYYAVVDYASKVPSPANSSGWFLPSIGQMWNVYQNRASLFEGKTVVSGLKSDWYWSSSEYYHLPACYALYVDVGDGRVYYDFKYLRSSYVRPVLAF